MSLLLAIFFSANLWASEDVLFLCGKGKEKGVKSAEFALVDDSESTIKFYRNGKQIAERDFDLASADHQWIVTFYGAKKVEADKKFVFSTKDMEMQAFDLLPENKEKKAGKALPCKK